MRIDQQAMTCECGSPGVWLRFGLAAAYLTVRRLLAGVGLKRG